MYQTSKTVVKLLERTRIPVDLIKEVDEFPTKL